MLNAHNIEVRINEAVEQRVKLLDVLVGPFNLEP
jgi:hypothetical protein